MIAGFFVYGVLTAEPPYTQGQVHWHSKVDIEICGKKIDLPRIPYGQGHLGSAVLHTHDDNVAHIEGQIIKKEDASLGKFMDLIGVKFLETQIFDKKNGDECEGIPGSLKMFVNGERSDEFRNHVLKDGEEIKIVFE